MGEGEYKHEEPSRESEITVKQGPGEYTSPSTLNLLLKLDPTSAGWSYSKIMLPSTWLWTYASLRFPSGERAVFVVIYEDRYECSRARQGSNAHKPRTTANDVHCILLLCGKTSKLNITPNREG